MTSCFSHAVAIAEGKFLSALSPTKKKKILGGGEIDVPVVPSPSEDPSAGEIDPEIDDEDTEEEIDALAREVEEAGSNLPDSNTGQLMVSLLLKVRGFIAKVCCYCLQ